jgi:hypothetical protein
MSDIFAYSFPNLLPSNARELEAYEVVDVWEFGTAPVLTTLLKSALPNTAILGHHQSPRFFRAYGATEAEDFIRRNWVAGA